MKRKLPYLTFPLILLAARYCRHELETALREAPQHYAWKRTNVLMSTAYPGAPPPPSAGDSANGEPPVGLSSDNPNERLQAVHQAQNKWGRWKVEKDLNQFAIVGRWNHPWTDTAHITFNANGTFKMVGWLRDAEGTYRFLSCDEMEINQPGIVSGRSVVNIPYRLLGDTLELNLFGDWVRYTRVAPVNQTIIGSWYVEVANNLLYSWTFDANGTCKEAARIVGPNGQTLLCQEAPGTYRFLPDQVIELTIHRAPDDIPVLKFKYRLSGDTLEVKADKDWRAFKRAPR